MKLNAIMYSVNSPIAGEETEGAGSDTVVEGDDLQLTASDGFAAAVEHRRVRALSQTPPLLIVLFLQLERHVHQRVV